MSRRDVTGIILAGGASARFGSDKLAAPVGGRPLLEHALEAVAAVAHDLVLVLGPASNVPVLPPGLRERVSILRDAAEHAGPLAGLAGALEGIVDRDATRADTLALVVGGDMPSMEPAVLRLLVDELATAPSLLAMTLGSPEPAPLPMAIRLQARAAAGHLLNGTGRRSLLALLESIPSGTVAEAAWRLLDPAGRTLRDVDTPADLQGDD